MFRHNLFFLPQYGWHHRHAFILKDKWRLVILGPTDGLSALRLFPPQAKYLAQIIVMGAQVVGRAFARAVRQEYMGTIADVASQRGQVSVIFDFHPSIIPLKCFCPPPLLAASQAAAKARGQSEQSAAASSITGMSLQEAQQILNISTLSPEDIQKVQKDWSCWCSLLYTQSVVFFFDWGKSSRMTLSFLSPCCLIVFLTGVESDFSLFRSK